MSNHDDSFTPAAELAEGPFYGRGGPLRSDIREDRDGLAFRLEVVVTDRATGEPLEGITVDIWHCDANGNYSGYETNADEQPLDVTNQMPVNSEMWLRGTQVTDDRGRAAFDTIYPGFYVTRAPHIHVKLLRGETCLLTSQLFLPETVSDQVYAMDPYGRSVEQDTRNASDTVIAFADAPVDGCWVDVVVESDRWRGTSRLAIDPAARSNPIGAPPDFRPPVGGVPHQQRVR